MLLPLRKYKPTPRSLALCIISDRKIHTTFSKGVCFPLSVPLHADICSQNSDIFKVPVMLRELSKPYLPKQTHHMSFWEEMALIVVYILWTLAVLVGCSWKDPSSSASGRLLIAQLGCDKSDPAKLWSIYDLTVVTTGCPVLRRSTSPYLPATQLGSLADVSFQKGFDYSLFTSVLAHICICCCWEDGH